MRPPAPLSALAISALCLASTIASTHAAESKLPIFDAHIHLSLIHI